MKTPLLLRPASTLRAFLRSEASGGIVLIVATLAAMLAANLPATRALYERAIHATIGPVLSPKLGAMTVHLWINDGLMALFFLLVGLEIKRELMDGRLAQRSKRVLPFLAAAAGMAMPALVFLLVAGGEAHLRRGWAIPAATDIAFAVGIMALLGPRVPASLKIFLTAVAIVDDMGAVAIIALVYTTGMDLGALAAAAGATAVLWALNRRGVCRLWPYIAGFALLWLLLLRSGVHATIAGVIAAAFVPLKRTPGAPDAVDSPLHRLEHALDGWVAYAVVPVFAFANAGIALGTLGRGAFTAPLVVAIAAGLFAGKQVGILGSIWLAERLGIARRPGNARWSQVWGVSLLAGVGFTMSLFIGGLAFPGEPELVEQVKLGVVLGSFLAAVAGYLLLRRTGATAA